MRKAKTETDCKPHPPAKTPEGREKQLISLAMDAAEKQLRDGTASAQVITHFLKLASIVSKCADKTVKGIELAKNEAHYQKTMSEVVKLRKAENYARTNKSEILKSPAKLNKYKDFYDDKTIKDAINKIQQEQTLNELSRKQIRNGADYAQSILAYGTAATSAYALVNSQPVKDAKKKRNK